MSPPESCYLDNNATTALDERVLEAMLPHLRESYGNPSSAHGLGGLAAQALELARERVARLVGASARQEIVFTSGGSESVNTAIQAACRAHGGRRRVVCSTVEHSAVLRPLERLQREGWELVRVGVDAQGELDERALLAAVDARCALLSLMWANNETGVLTRSGALALAGQRCREVGAWFHVDAMQAAGKMPLEVRSLPIDLLSISAHKFHGPKGAGALYVRSGLPFEALILGGPQEQDRRAGTENVPAIAGLGRAAELALEWLADPARPAALAALRDRLETGLIEACREDGGVLVNGAGAQRLPNTSSLCFEGAQAEALQMLLDTEGIAVSTGSACSSEMRAPSHVLIAMGLSPEQATGTLRFSLSRRTIGSEVERALEVVPRSLAELRALNGLTTPRGTSGVGF